MTPEMIQALYANAGAPVASNKGRAVWTGKGYALPNDKKQTKGRGGPATAWISEAAGTGGAVGGAALGATLGSVVPVVGTAAGGLVGGILGGFAGGFGGKAAENKIRDDQYRLEDALTEGLISGAFSGVGQGGKLAVGAVRGSRAASKAIPSVINVADDVANVADDAVSTGTQKVLKTSTTGKLNTLGNKALMSQYGTIGKPTARANDPLGTISKLADYGITKPKDAERIAASITGSDGILNRVVMSAVDSSTTVPTTGINSTLKKAITTQGLVDKDAKSVTNVVKAQLKAVQDAGNSPNAIMTAIKNLEKRAANLQGKGGNYGMATPERVDQSKALLAVRDDLEERLYKASGANANLQNVLTPQLRDELIQLNPGNKQWQNFVDNTVMKSKDINSLRSAQSPFVKISRIIDEGDVNAMTFGGRASNGVMNGGTLTNTIANVGATMLKNPAARVVSKPLRGIGSAGEMIPSMGKARAPLGFAGATIGRGMVNNSLEQPATLEDALMDYSIGPNMENSNSMMTDMTNSNAMIPNTANMMGSQYPQTDDMSMGYAQENPYPRENLLYDMQRDPANADKYLKTYQMYQEIFTAPEAGSDLSQSSKNALASSDNALNTVNQLEQLFTNAGSGSGRLGGTVKGWAANAGLDEDAKIYNSLANASVTQIAKALAGSGSGTVSDMDAKVIIAALPTIRDTPAEARAKFAALKQRLENAKQNTLMYGGGQTRSLEDAIMQSQGAYQ